MADKRGQQGTGDTGSPSSRARDDLRTGSKKHKPNDQRAEGRDKNDVAKAGESPKEKKSDNEQNT